MLKKFQFEEILTSEQISKMKKTLQPLASVDTKVFKNQQKLLFSNNGDGTGKFVKAFIYNKDGVDYFVPEPSPVLIHFYKSITEYNQIKNTKPYLLKALDKKTINESIRHLLYDHFSYCMGFVISIFTSLEAFLNLMIPEEYEYKKIGKNRTEIYNKNQIQRYSSFMLKSKEIIIDITSNNFSQEQPIKWQYIMNLKELRDMIIHTKIKDSSNTPYKYLFEKLLDFNYEKSLYAIKDYINFHKPNHIE